MEHVLQRAQGFQIVDTAFEVPLFEGAESAGGHGHCDDAARGWVHETTSLEIWVHAAAGFLLRVAHVVACRNRFASNYAGFCHK